MAEDNRIWYILGIIIILILISNQKISLQSCNPIWLPDSRYDSVTFCSQEEALTKTQEIGCTGFHTHIQNGETIYMSCEKHEDLDPIVGSIYGG